MEIIVDVKSAFENLDKIIADIDCKNNHYMKNAAARAKFELSSGINQEGKINSILRYLSEFSDDDEELDGDLFDVFSQKFISEESVKKVPEKKSYDAVASIQAAESLTREEKELRKKLLQDRQQLRIYRKKIEDFVSERFGSRNSFLASEIKIENRKDFETLIYIRLFAQSSRHYGVKRTSNRVRTDKAEFMDFEIVKKKIAGGKL